MLCNFLTLVYQCLQNCKSSMRQLHPKSETNVPPKNFLPIPYHVPFRFLAVQVISFPILLCELSMCNTSYEIFIDLYYQSYTKA